ncbi:uncharacterized protein TRIADDRAFT_61172 [Trichoplax adhaerens]|uniref:Protein amnionless n=1 Tax=Trichoplax adhaerens TaxID=10228 RepID=B3SA84_TRIAD|nr:hypothetical protein TRIADDRAFT_61172 [Trichoplax adhaerens]EDV20393.1 hypothetical protein TRIADDRAFT_61172 [Trichoplax adhaerens]|eukprot:XP_002117087.1 hypothetical protein TRIADDRAFT_61172 [Trichoplax adhaerens]
MEKVCFILALTAIYGAVAQNIPTYKQWIPNTNYNNPDNWSKKRLPCSQDTITFQKSNYTVYLQNTLSVQELILPVDGDFVLEEGFTIEAPPTPSSSPTSSPSSPPCQTGGSPNVFIGDIPKNWFNPSNWFTVDGPTGSSIPGKVASNVMQTEQIPCLTDTAIFPSNAFAVNITLPVIVGSILINGQQYLGQQFANYLATPVAQNQFYFGFGASVTVQDSTCTNSSGCPCGYSGGVFQYEICRQSICPRISCSKPLAPPLGSCCKICGTVMQFSISSTFNITEFEQQIKVSFLNAATNVLYNIQTTANGTVLLILQDTNNGSTSGTAAINVGKNIFDKIRSGW